MKQKLSQNITYWLGVAAIGLVVGLSLQFVRAWTEPAVAPPGGNVGAPINTSGAGQTKVGGLQLNCGTGLNCAFNGTSAANGLLVPNGNVGIGTANPFDILHVAKERANNGTDNLAQIVISGSGATNDRLLLGYNTTADNGFIQSVHNALGYTSLLLNPNGGNVGIGTANPGTNKLQVNGKIQAIGGDICTDQGGGKCLSSSVTLGQNTCSWSGEANGAVYCAVGYYVAGINCAYGESNSNYCRIYCCKP